jgi:prepilin-type N-terminal cleavage/methylation domain-containing protein
MALSLRALRRGFTLIELLVVIGVIGLLMALLLPALQRVRESAMRSLCGARLQQLGVALQNYHNDHNHFPAGVATTSNSLSNGDATGFTMLLPYLEQRNAYELYTFDQAWWEKVNHQAVAVELKVLYCPSNRDRGTMGLVEIGKEWGFSLPPLVGSTDYVFSKGATAVLQRDSSRFPQTVRGVFDVNSSVSLSEMARLDGASSTILMGEGWGGNPQLRVRDRHVPTQAATDAKTGQPYLIEQAWGAGCTSSETHPYYGSVLAVTAQRGLPDDPMDEPMNPPSRLISPTYDGGDVSFQNDTGLDRVSGFRSLHTGGCYFLFADGGVRFIKSSVTPAVYRALSTYAGNEPIPGDW